MTRAHDKPLRHVHSCGKHHDEEVASSKKEKIEFKTRVQKLTPYLLPKWQQNSENRSPIYDQSN